MLLATKKACVLCGEPGILSRLITVKRNATNSFALISHLHDYEVGYARPSPLHRVATTASGGTGCRDCGGHLSGGVEAATPVSPAAVDTSHGQIRSIGGLGAGAPSGHGAGVRQELLAEGGTVLSSVAEQAVIRRYQVSWPGH